MRGLTQRYLEQAENERLVADKNKLLAIIMDLARKPSISAGIGATPLEAGRSGSSDLLTVISSPEPSEARGQQTISRSETAPVSCTASPVASEVAPTKCRVPVHPFNGKVSTISTMWKEYDEGLEGQPSIKQLIKDHGESWMFWKADYEQLLHDADGNILRYRSEPKSMDRQPLRNWVDAWCFFSKVFRRLELYVEVLRDGFGFSEQDAGATACRILEREKEKSGISSLRAFIDKHCKVSILEDLVKGKHTVLKEQLARTLAELQGGMAA